MYNLDFLFIFAVLKLKIMRTTLLLLMMFVSMFAYSQTDTTKTVKLSNIDVTGVIVDKTPISQKTINRSFIDKQSYSQEMVYIIDKTLSITSQSDGGQPNGYVSFRLRGIDQSRINMTLNGVPLNEPEDQGVYFSNYPNFASSLKSMQIQRGVGTSANGTSSYGGSINFESRDGLVKGGEVSLTNGSYDTQIYNVNYGTGLINKFSMFGSLTGYKSDGYKYNSWGKGRSAFVSFGYFEKNDIIKFTGFTGLSKNGMAWYAVAEKDLKNDPRTTYNSPEEKDYFKQSFAQLQWIHSFNKYSTLTSTVFYNRLNGNYGTLTNLDVLYNIDLSSNYYGLMNNFRFSKNNLTLNIGDNINFYDRTHVGTNEYIGDQFYKNIGYKNEFSGYAKVNYKINKFDLFGDLQLRDATFDYSGGVDINKQDWLFLNSRGGLTYNIDVKQNIYASIGQSHREPTRTDLFGGNDNLIVLNDVKPESVIDYELGYNLKTDKLKLQTNVFYMDFSNEITLAGGFNSNSLLKTISVDKSFRCGLEFDATYKLNNHFTLNNSSSYMYAKIEGENEERTQLLTPKFIINQDVEYTIGKVFVNVATRYLSKSYINLSNTETIPSYVLVNSKFGYKTKRYELSAQVNNIFDKLYYTGGYESKSYFIGSPRSLYVTLKINL